MKKIYQIDENGFYLGDSFIPRDGDVPDGYTDIPLPDGLYKPQLVEGVWQNGLTAEEIEAMKPKEEKSVKQLLADLYLELFLKGVL